MLSEEGYKNVLTASSGSKALSIINETKPDIILLDIMMPEMDGLDFCNALQSEKETSDIPVIMITAKNTEEDLRRGFEAGAFDYIKKPFDVVELIARLSSALKIKKSNEEINNIQTKNKAILDAIPDLMFRFTRDGEFLDFKSGDLKDLYVSPENIIGNNISNIMPPSITEKCLKYASKTLDLGIIQVFEYSLSMPGGLKNYEARLVPSGENEVLAIIRNITDYKMADEAFKKERDNAKKYLELAEVMFVALNSEGKVTLVNNKSCQILGYKKDEILSKNWFDNFIPKRLQDEVKLVFKMLVVGDLEPVEYFENPILTKSGKERIIAWHNTLLKDNGGNIVGTLSSGEDVTEKKRAEELLKVSEKKYSNVVEQAIDAIVIIQDGVFKFANKRLAYFSKYSVEELVGMNFQKLISPESVDLIAKRVEKRLAGEYVPNFYEAELLDKEGHKLPVEVNANLIEYDCKPADLVFLRDISDRKKMENALRESEEKYSTLVEMSGDGIGLIQGGKLIFANRSLYKLLGIEEDELLGKSIFSLVSGKLSSMLRVMSDQDKRTLMKSFSYLVKEKVPSDSYQFPILKKSGEVVWIEMRTNSIMFKGKKAAIGFFRDITEQKKIENSLRESEKRYSTIVEGSNDGIIIVEVAGFGRQVKVVFANQKTAHITGYSIDEIYNLNLLKSIPPKHLIKALNRYRSRLAGENISPNIEIEVIRKGGKKIPVELSGTWIDYRGQKALAIFIRDISERKVIENSLRESEKRYSTVAEEGNDGILILKGLKIMFANKRLGEMIGFSKEESNQLFKSLANVSKIIDFKQLIGALDQYRRRMAGEKVPQNLDLNLSHKDGHIIPVELSSTKIEYEGGPADLIFIRDISERKQMMEELKESEEKYSALVEMSGDGIGLLQRGKVLFANRKAHEMFGVAEHDIENKNIFNLLSGKLSDTFGAMSGDNIKEVIKNFSCVAKGSHVSFSYQAPIKKKSNEVFWVEVRGDPIVYKGKTAHLLLLRNITDQKQAEEEIKRTLENLERSNKELEQFAFVASHDLQEPLRMIASFIQLLSRRYKGRLDSDADEFIDYAVEGTVRMKNMINDLSNFSRVGMYGKPFEKTDLKSIIEKTQSHLAKLIEDNDALITYDFMPTILADKSQIFQIFVNLIENAIKYKSLNPPRIHISSEKRNDEWIFSVSDNGIGIDSEDRDNIFQIFRRMDKPQSGTGIGLAICKRIVQRHGGRMWAESELEKGSTFYFTIPSRGNGKK